MGAVVAGEEHERVVGEAELLEPVQDPADLPVHVADHRREARGLVLPLGSSGDRVEGIVRQGHRVPREEGLLAGLGREGQQGVHRDVGAVGPLEGLQHAVAVDLRIVVARAEGLDLPEAPGVEARVAGMGARARQRAIVLGPQQLPLAEHAGGVAGVAQQLRDGHFVRIEDREAGVVPQVAAAREELDPARRAERLGVAVIELHALGRHAVEARRRVALAPVGAEALQPRIVREHEDEVRSPNLCRRSGSRAALRGPPGRVARRQQEEREGASHQERPTPPATTESNTRTWAQLSWFSAMKRSCSGATW